MGCGGSKKSNQWIARKLTKNDVLYEPLTTQWIVGNGDVFTFNIQTMTLTRVDIPKDIIIGDRCACCMSNRYTQDKRLIFYVSGGNDDYKEFYDVFYEFDIDNPTKPKKLPKMPKKVSHHNLVEADDGRIILIGGKYGEKGPVSDEVYSYTPSTQKWDLINVKLPKPRTNFKCVLDKNNVFMFSGDNGNGRSPTTQIDILNLKTNKIQTAKYRLPLGVTGASMAFFADDVLLIGGDRMGEASTSVMKLDFQDMTILSLRDLTKPRSNAIILQTKFDEMIAIGGNNDKSAEKRCWNPKENDYCWQDCTKEIKGLNLLGNPNEYSMVGSTFKITGSSVDPANNMDPESSFIFGNELSPFMLEFNDFMRASFFPAPLMLQQKTGQKAWRRGKKEIIFIGGSDSTYTVFSKKTFKFNIALSKCVDMGKMTNSRTAFATAESGGYLYVMGGFTDGFKHLNGVERFDLKSGKSWEVVDSMNKPRSGHITWVCPKTQNIYVAGGVSQQNGKPLKCVEVYDVKNNKWSMHSKTLPEGLHGADTMNHADGDKLIVFGGATGGKGEQSATNTIKLLSRSNFNGFEGQTIQMRAKRYKPFALLAGKDDTIIIIGGTKELVLDVFNYVDLKPYPDDKLQKLTNEVYDNLDNFTLDMALKTCSAC